MRAQRGQAIVIVALVLLALLGIVALGIDAGRAYSDRRQVQAASDAAALTAAGDYHVSKSTSHAAQRGAQLFAHNVGMTDAQVPTVTLGTPFTLGSYTVTISLGPVPSGASYTIFAVTATHRLPVALMQVLGVNPNMTIAADAQAVSDYGFGSAGMVALSSGCGSQSQNAIFVTGNADVSVDGDIYSDGGISTSHNSGITLPDGTAYYACGTDAGNVTPSQKSSPITVTYPEPGPISSTNRGPLKSGVDALPGTYGQVVKVQNNECYFLAPGVYLFQSGITVTGGTISNELRSPDEALPGADPTQPANPALWDTCNRPVTLAAATGGTIAAQSMAVRVTSVRQDGGWTRESAPSVCRTVTIPANGKLTVNVPLTPGAQGYNVYVAPTCGGAFRYAKSSGDYRGLTTQVRDGSSTVSVLFSTDTDLRTGVTPSACAASARPAPWTTVAAGQSCTIPAGESSDDHTVPKSADEPNDLANENLCVVNGAQVPCANTTPTPGGVALVLANGQTASITGGTTYVFSGGQYAWVILWSSPTAPEVTDSLTGGGYSKYIGVVYLPTADLKIAGGASTPFVGQVVAYTITIAGGSGVVVQVDTNMTQQPPPARLIV